MLNFNTQKNLKDILRSFSLSKRKEEEEKKTRKRRRKEKVT